MSNCTSCYYSGGGDLINKCWKCQKQLYEENQSWMLDKIKELEAELEQKGKVAEVLTKWLVNARPGIATSFARIADAEAQVKEGKQ